MEMVSRLAVITWFVRVSQVYWGGIITLSMAGIWYVYFGYSILLW
jgi:hypothetical protein